MSEQPAQAVPLARPRQAKPNGAEPAPFARGPVDPTAADLADWQRGAAALSRMPARLKLELTEGIGEERARASAELGAGDRYVEHLRNAPESDIGGEVPEWRTLADIDDTPPGDLLLGMLEDGPNLLYALGGTGKGSTGAWMCGELIEQGIRPMIYDAENRPKEWARRVSGLGIDRRQVIYLQPGDLPKAMLGQPVWDIAPYLGRVARSTGAGVLLVDSILPAVGLGEERMRSDAQVPYLYVGALDALGIPSVSFGHPPKGQPEGDPFGSVAWVNSMRLTWNGTQAEAEGHVVRWRPRKRNERGYIAGVLLTFQYGADNRLAAVERSDDDESTREWLLGALVGGPRAVADLAEMLTDELEEASAADEARAQERIGRLLRRMAREGWVEKVGTAGRRALWALKVR